MFAIAFDLSIEDTAHHHPKSVRQAYLDIENLLGRYGFERVQGSLFTTSSLSMVNVFEAITALKALNWFPTSVRDIRAFRVEQWSDFTATVKQL